MHRIALARVAVCACLVSGGVAAGTAQATSISLSTGSGVFGGELLQGAGSPKVGVILLHGRGLTPNSAVTRQLRNSLNHDGYSTLAIENPVPADYNGNGINTDFFDYLGDIGSTGANYVFPETYARIRASSAYLQSLGVNQIVLSGFSLGSRLAAAHIARGQQAGDLPIVGLLNVGMYGNSIDPYNVVYTLDEITIPVLDIYGDEDVNAVTTAAARVAAYAGASGDYLQVALDCPAISSTYSVNDCHKLRGNNLKGADDRPLENTARNWMQSVAPLASASVPEPGTGVLLALALGAMGWHCRRRTLGGGSMQG